VPFLGESALLVDHLLRVTQLLTQPGRGRPRLGEATLRVPAPGSTGGLLEYVSDEGGVGLRPQQRQALVFAVLVVPFCHQVGPPLLLLRLLLVVPGLAVVLPLAAAFLPQVPLLLGVIHDQQFQRTRQVLSGGRPAGAAGPDNAVRCGDALGAGHGRQV